MEQKKIHYLEKNNYYLCIRAVGNDVLGIVTKKWKFVTCKNCIARRKIIMKGMKEKE